VAMVELLLRQGAGKFPPPLQMHASLSGAGLMVVQT
jgi:hypothetical protein